MLPATEKILQKTLDLKVDEEVSISMILCDRRIQKNIDISTASQVLNIRREYLKAIEQGDITALPERVYTLGFVRAYARYLDMDIDTTLQRFKLEILGDSKKPIYTLPIPLNENSKPHRWLVFLSVALSIIVLGAWFFFYNFNFRQHTETPMPALIKSKAKDIAGLPAVSYEEPIIFEFEKSLDTLPEQKNIKSLTLEPNVNTPSREQENSSDNSQSIQALESSKLPLNIVLSNAENIPFEIPSASLKVVDTTWIEIKNLKGHLIEKRLFHAADRLPIYPYTVVLKIGNGAGVHVLENGRSKPLGKKGEVIHNFHLLAKK